MSANVVKTIQSRSWTFVLYPESCPEDWQEKLLGVPFLRSPLHDKDVNPDGTLTPRSEKVLNKTPMRRFGDITELNGAAQFLCSDAASFITGVILPVDGGFSSFSGV